MFYYVFTHIEQVYAGGVLVQVLVTGVVITILRTLGPQKCRL